MKPNTMLLPVRVLGVLLLCGVFLWPCAAQDAVRDLEREVAAKSGLARRQAARRLLELGPEASDAIVALTKDPDVIIRRNALRQLRRILGEKAVPLYRQALEDASPLVRLVAVEELTAFSPRSAEVTEALMQATKDPDNEVRKRAAGTFWQFHRDYVTLRKRPNWDHAIEALQVVPLPMEGWRLRTDPGRIGHVQQWFAPDLDESAWHDVVIGKWWHDALPEKVGSYEGIAWYRFTFVAPPKPAAEFNEAVLHFGAVDESTWVWVNGQYAGEHDFGTSGWNVPFDIEVGSMLKWDEANQITVRVLNAAGAGGIYKPVEFQVLK